MQAHLPKPLHGWRAFVGEVGIIVLGVLIALAAGEAVETLHSGRKARVAERAMRLELAEDNGPQAYARAVVSRCFDRRLGWIHDNAATANPAQLRTWIASYSPPFRTWDSEVWKFVVSSDVGNYIGAEGLVRWSAAYRVLPGLNDSNAHETELASELRDAIPPLGEISSADRGNVRRLAGLLRIYNQRITRGSQLFLVRIRNLDAGVSTGNQHLLMDNARALYGSCASVPDFGVMPEAGRSTANLRGFIY